MKTRNVTLALPEDFLRRIEIAAAGRDTSISAMLTEALRQIVDAEDGYTEAQRLMLADLKKGYRLGTHGKIGSTRDSVHQR